MESLPRDAIARARAQFGLLTTGDLDAAGVSKHRRLSALESGLMAKVHGSVYKLSSHAESFEQRCLAASLAAPDAALSGPTAGRLLGLRKMTGNDVHIVARRTVVLEGVVAHRTNFLSDLDIERRGPFRMLRPSRLTCDLAAYLSDDDLESVIEQLLDRKLIALPTVRQLARGFVASGRNGSARLARVLDGRPTWRRPAQSDLELRLTRALARTGWQLVPQFTVELDTGRRIVFDLADPVLRLGIEVDHQSWHGGRLDVQRDKSRDRGVLRLGWTVARVTDEDINIRLNQTALELLAIAAALRSRPQDTRDVLREAG